MAKRIYLPVVEPHDADSVIAAAKPGFPVLKGEEDDHLACGHCRDVLAWNVSVATVREKFVVAQRLILACPCGASNLIAVRI